MTRILLDSGALLALERDERPMWGRLERARRERFRVLTHGGVLALLDAAVASNVLVVAV